jgi:tRNA (mo5U34)-methyltransferase
MTATAQETAIRPAPGALPPEPDHWFHSFAFPDGTRVSGIKKLEVLQGEADLIFPDPLAGKRVLDIGAWDGFFSFEAERRGSAEVLATDHFCWSGPGWGDKRGFDHAHARFGSKVRSLDLDIADHSVSALGTFDTVLLLGVLYHVTDPYRILESAAAMCTDHLVVETVTALRHEAVPAMRLFTELELDKDPTNFWAPNILALREMCRRFGFTRFQVLPEALDNAGWRKWTRPFRRQDAYRRAIFHAWR